MPIYTIQNSTSFFLKALESQQAILEEKKFKASSSSPFRPKDRAVDKKRKDKQDSPGEKMMNQTMQKSVLDSLTFEMLNPVVLINKE